jgi:hypothetical protein
MATPTQLVVRGVQRLRPEKSPLAAARAYLHARLPHTDVHTAYTEALAYYERLRNTKPLR